jgi:glycosyltransferase involved in cell wall biosynthesis
MNRVWSMGHGSRYSSRSRGSGLAREPFEAIDEPGDRSEMSETCLKVVLASHGASLGGGAERSLLELAVALKQDGRVDPLVTVPSNGALDVALREASIRTVVLRTPLWAPYNPNEFRSSVPFGGLAKKSRRALAIARLSLPWVRWLRTERPDVVLTSTATIPLPAFASALVDIPHVWWLQEFVTKDHGLRYMFGEPLSQRWIGWLSTLVVANSNAVLDHYSPPIRSRKMRVIYLGIPDLNPSPNRIDLPALRVLLLGRQTPAKGQHLALEALSILKSEPIQIDLRLVGSIGAAYKAELQGLAFELGISDSVEILDATTTPQDELAWANVVLMCSECEAFGRVTVEALKSGRPVVGARSGGTPEIVSADFNGFLFEPGNPEELAAALRRLASEPGLLVRMSKNARASTQGLFTLQNEVDAFVDVLASAAAQRRDLPHVSHE